MGLQISIRESDDVTILDLTGRVMVGVDTDLLSPQLLEVVAKGARKLLLNLIAVTLVDSSGVSAIAKTYNSLIRRGGSLKLLCPPGHVRSVLRMVRLLDIVPTFEDEAQALASFQEVHPPIHSGV
jgi:anti-sigma B factor antagonist